MRAPEFEAMIGPAKLYPQLWRLLCGLALVAFFYLGVMAIEALALSLAVGQTAFSGMLGAIAQPEEPLPTVLLLLTFPGLLLGAVVAAAACHFRGPSSLFGPAGETLRGFLVAVAVTAPAYALAMGLAALAGPPLDNLPWEVWARWAPLALPLILIQVTAEEAVFRGYLQQQLAARFAARWIWMGLPSVLFAVLHVHPLAIAATFVVALIFADLTERTGSLGAAIGLHFVNNVFGLLVVSTAGTITGLSRWISEHGLDDFGPLAVATALQIVFMLALWRVLIRVLER